MNWASYATHWDEFIEKWVKDPIALAQRDPLLSGRIVMDEILDLPEPYYGDILSSSVFDAVILNLNPGLSASNEWVKYHCFMDNPNAFIAHELKGNVSLGCYQRINQLFNPLRKESLSSIPGKEWWERHRFEWLDTFYPSGGRSNGGYNQNNVLALEFSPWHSKESTIRIKKTTDPRLLSYIATFIVDPLSDAIRRSKLKGKRTGSPFGLCFSRVVHNCLIDHFDFTPVSRWDAKTASVVGGWPYNKSGKPKNRTYSLIEGIDSNNNKFLLLCLWYANIGVKAPSKEFAIVEQFILNQI